MSIYLNLAMSILIIIYSKEILIKIIQNSIQNCLFSLLFVFKHKLIFSKSILSKIEPNTQIITLELIFLYFHYIEVVSLSAKVKASESFLVYCYYHI